MPISSSDEGLQPWQTYETVFTNAKAGMDGVDKEKVQKIVYEMSKGSKFFENEERKATYTKQKIEQLNLQASLLSVSDTAKYEKIADQRVLELESSRNLSRIWMHVDMDAFYAAVETLENPSLVGKPMAVGSMSMICTANYEARKYGVRAAMPGFIARKLCPDLIFVPTNFVKYSHYSELTRKVFREYDPRFIARSLDEAYLDITDACIQRGMSGEAVAEEIRHAVYGATGLTCSAGVAANRMLAKVCSDVNKPNGQFVLPNERLAIMTFVSSLPIRKVSGIGKVTEQIVKDVLGVITCKDLVEKRAMVCALFSSSSADFFLSVGLGLGGAEHPDEEPRKSISVERTFSATKNDFKLLGKLEEIADTLSKDMEKEGLRGRTLTLKLKTSTFEVRTRATTLQSYIYTKEDILNNATKLLRNELPVSLRLIGIRISHFKDEKVEHIDPTQRTLTGYMKASSTSKQLGSSDSSNSGKHTFDYSECAGSFQDNILDKEIYHADLVSREASNSILKYFRPEFYSNQCAHRKVANAQAETDKLEVEGHLALAGDMCNSSHLRKTDSRMIDFSSSFERDYREDQSMSTQHGASSSNVESHEINGPFSQFSELMFWKDGYCCSLCGIELPECFVEEQQEHSDYHLAQILQKEESSTSAPELLRQSRTTSGRDTGQLMKRRNPGKTETCNRKRKIFSIDSFFQRETRPG